MAVASIRTPVTRGAAPELPTAVVPVNEDGTAVSGGGAGVEYTEDAAAAADPVGRMLIARRRDTLSSTEVSANGDNIALNATKKGELRTSTSPTIVSTPTRTDVAAAVADTAILAANADRLPGSRVTNDSTAILYLVLGSGAASATNFTVAIDGKTTVPGSFELPTGYTGAVRGYWASATGNARITELSA